MVDADLLCVWGICDHSTQSKKGCCWHEGLQGVARPRVCERAFLHSHIFVAFSVSLTDILPVT